MKRIIDAVLVLTIVVVLAAPLSADSQSPQATALTTVRVASGLSSPLFVTAPPGDFSRLFIVEQGGRIKILKNGAILPTPFLNLVGHISSGDERGLLGLAFHPSYATNGYFYVDYTNPAGNTTISRFTVSANPDRADSLSEQILLVINQPFANHNGGMVAFGPNDGYLYIGMGDGGDAGDPDSLAQADTTLLGKILRIDVDTVSGYRIPPSNPFAGPDGIRDEIWAKGTRNPWRYSFDRATGDLYIGDVGQNKYEEIDYQPAASTGGENYGWRFMEGNHCYNPSNNCDPGGLTYPIHEYSHAVGYSTTGGYVYRGCAIPDLMGTYFFGDYGTKKIWSFRYDGVNMTGFTDRTAELDPPGSQAIDNISSFGEDAAGELYVVDYVGEVYKIIPATAISPDCNSNGLPDSCDILFGISLDIDQNQIPDECGPLCGDVNGDTRVNVADATFLINYVFVPGSPPPNPLYVGDANCDTRDNVADATFIINFVFTPGSPTPCDPDHDGVPNCP